MAGRYANGMGGEVLASTDLMVGRIHFDGRIDPVQTSLRMDARRFEERMEGPEPGTPAVGRETGIRYEGEPERDGRVIELLRSAADHADAGETGGFITDMRSLAQLNGAGEATGGYLRIIDLVALSSEAGASVKDWMAHHRRQGESLARAILPVTGEQPAPERLASLLAEVRRMNERDEQANDRYTGADDTTPDEANVGDEERRSAFLRTLAGPVELPDAKSRMLTSIITSNPLLRGVITEPESTDQAARAIRAARGLLDERRGDTVPTPKTDDEVVPEYMPVLDAAREAGPGTGIDVDELTERVGRTDYTLTGMDNELIHPTRLIASGYYDETTISDLLTLLAETNNSLANIRRFLHEADQVAHSSGTTIRP
ncbi:hypothetical protein EMO89_00470 [Bifidobacterium tissieri]|uniref:Uncharacterized protein n=1 Tax=Bifidobacterium tissieri TaxID=1630162 RepID=A0A5M9ZWP8_9BIFI|nr:hypothetical protein [Bifidobacterium tissieri]KAA8832036.1 hypothetical protein EMO89_00470 [Bifidobacterium tissieri]